jgi:hypothetical protein
LNILRLAARMKGGIRALTASRCLFVGGSSRWVKCPPKEDRARSSSETLRTIRPPDSATIDLREVAAALSPQFALVVESLMKRTFNKSSDRHSLAQVTHIPSASRMVLWCT